MERGYCHTVRFISCFSSSRTALDDMAAARVAPAYPLFDRAPRVYARLARGSAASETTTRRRGRMTHRTGKEQNRIFSYEQNVVDVIDFERVGVEK